MQFFKRNLYDIKGLKKWRMRFRIPTPIAGITSTLTLSGEKVMAICGENTTDAPTSVKTQERTNPCGFFVKRGKELFGWTSGALK